MASSNKLVVILLAACCVVTTPASSKFSVDRLTHFHCLSCFSAFWVFIHDTYVHSNVLLIVVFIIAIILLCFLILNENKTIEVLCFQRSVIVKTKPFNCIEEHVLMTER